MNQKQKEQIKVILNSVKVNGLTWKEGSLQGHVAKRIRRKDLPPGTTAQDYEALILNILNNLENAVIFYFEEGFKQDYFVFTNYEWIVMIGENCVMETAMPPKNVRKYTAPEKGYTYLGTIEEAFK